jgi:hypothetical protein
MLLNGMNITQTKTDYIQKLTPGNPKNHDTWVEIDSEGNMLPKCFFFKGVWMVKDLYDKWIEEEHKIMRKSTALLWNNEESCFVYLYDISETTCKAVPIPYYEASTVGKHYYELKLENVWGNYTYVALPNLFPETRDELLDQLTDSLGNNTASISGYRFEYTLYFRFYNNEVRLYTDELVISLETEYELDEIKSNIELVRKYHEHSTYISTHLH